MKRFLGVLCGGLLLASSLFLLGSCGGSATSSSATNYDMSKVSFNDSSFTYDGEEHSIFVSGDLPDGVSVSYQGNQKVNAGEYKVTAKFTGTAENYTPISDLTANMTIAKASIGGISFVGKSFVYDGQPHSLAIGGTLPEGVTVSYAYNGMTEAGTYSVVASFTDTTGNYNKLPDITATMTISKADYDMSKVTFDSASYIYDGTEKRIEIKGTLPIGVSVSYKDNVLTDVGELTAVASFSHSNKNYNDIPDKTATLTVSKSSLSGISFSGSTVTYDGDPHSLSITGTLPSGVTVSYTNNGQTDAGSYDVTAHFSDSTGNYTLPADMTAKLVINQASYDASGLSFNDASYTYDGTEKTLAVTGNIPEGVTVTCTNNTLTNVGSVNATATFAVDSNHKAIPSMNATLTITKSSLSGISFSGSTVTYDGIAHSLAITGTLPSGVTVSYTNNGQTDAGAYSIIAHFSDSTGNYTLPADMTAKLVINQASYDISGLSFNDASYTYDGTEKALTVSGTIPEGVAISYTSNRLTNVGSLSVTASFMVDSNHKAIPSISATLTITKSSIPSISFSGSTVTFDGNSHSIFISGSLPSGVSVSYLNNGQIDSGTYKVVAHFSDSTGNYVLPEDMTANLVINQASYSTSGFSFNDASYTYDGTEKDLVISGDLPEGVTVSYTSNKLTDAGSIKVTASFIVDSNHAPISPMTATLTVSKASFTGVSFSGSTVTYDGNAHSLSITGTLPDGVTVSYSNNGKTDSGVYDVVACFSDSTGNYNLPDDMTAKLTISKADYDMSGVSFVDVSYTYDGTEKTVVISGNLPSGVSVTYKGNSLTAAGSIKATASFKGDANHNAIADLNATLTIAKSTIAGISFTGASYVYDGSAHSLAITGTLPSGVTVSYTNNGQIDAGTYSIIAHFSDSTGNYALPDDMTASLVISKASYPVSGFSFDDKTYVYDGTEKSLTVTGTLPEGVSVKYTSNKLTDVGQVVVTASFTVDSNHQPMADMSATLTISKASIAAISFSGTTLTYDGSSHSISIDGTLPAGVTVTYDNNGQIDAGTYSIIAHFSDSTGNYVLPADMTAKLVINQASYDASGLSFDDKTYVYDGTEKSLTVSGTLPDGVTVSYTNNTLTNVGSVNATAAFAVDSNHKAIPSMSATLTISKASIAGISFSGATLTYDGSSHSIYIDGTLPAGVTVTYDKNGQIDAGTYEVVAHFTDSTGNYNVPSDMTAKLIILKASYSMLGVTFDDVSYTYDGTEKTITVTGTLPEGVTVIYSSNKLTNAGSILATAAFVVDANHNAIDSMQATLTIAKASISGVSFSGSTVTYDGNAHSIYVAGTLPFGVTASYVNNGDINAGEYTVTASFADSTGNYIVPSDMTAKITIAKATYDMSGISFVDTSYTYDGTEKTLVIAGTLPEGVSVSYTANKLTNVGSLTVTASFEGDSANYNAIDSMTAVLTINKKSIDGISLTGATYVYDGTAKSVFISGTLPTGVNVTYTNNGKSDAGSYTVTACFSDTTGNYSVPNDISTVMNISKATYDMSGVTFNNVSYVYDGNEKTLTITGTLPDGVTVSYTANKLTNVGFVEVTASFTVDANHNAISEMKATLTITKASVTGISFSGNTVTYDSSAYSLAIEGALPTGVTVSYTDNGKTNAGTYTVTAHFADSTGNYNVPDDMTAKLTINKKTYDMTGVTFSDASYTYDGTEKTIVIAGSLPDGVTVSYANNKLTNTGSVEATAAFAGDSANYEPIPSMKATLTIGKKTVTGISLSGSTYTYDGTAKSISVTGTLPSGVTVTYTNNGKTNAGTYSVTAHFADSTGNYTVPNDMTASLMISKATYDMTGVSFDSVSYIYDGTEKTLVITGTLPDGVTVSYTSNKLTDAGSLSVTAAFTGDSANYNSVDSMTAVLTITKKNVTGISFNGQTFGYDGTSKSISVTGTLPSGVTVSYTNNGQTNVGEYTVTASFADSTGNYIVPSDITAKITITKGTYDMSGVSFDDATYTYDGTEKTIAIAGTLPSGVTVSYTTNKMTNAGTLTVTATFTGDSANYNSIDSMTAVLTISGQKLSAPSIDYDGEWVEWSKVTGADYYIVTINGVDTKTTDLYLSVPAATRTIEFVITCKAYGNDSANIIPSDPSNTLHRFGDITNIKVVDGVLTWDAVEGVEGYMLTINSNNVMVTTNSYAFADEAAGDMTVKICAKGKDDTKSTFDGNASSGAAVTKLTSSFNLREEDDIIKWDGVAGATGYVLSLNGIEQTFDSTVTSYYVTGGVVGSNAIKVYALGDSTKYITGSYTSVLNVTKYPVPSNYKASGSRVSWDAVSGVTKYIVYVNGTEVDNGSNAYFELGDSYSAGSYTIKVKGYSSNANCVFSDYTAEISVTKIGKVSGVAVVGGVLTWNAVDNAASYLVTVGSSKYTVSSDKTSYVVMDASGTYSITVQAIGDGTSYFNGIASDSLSVTKIATSVISYANGAISWAAVDHATGYNLYINGTKVSNGTSTSYTITIDGSASYAIAVEAVGDNAYLSSMSTYSAVASIGMPSLAVSGDGVSWKAVSDATGYILVVNGTSHCFDATVTSYSLTGQASGDYEFQLVAVSNKSSSFSYSADGKKTITKLVAVTNIAASSGVLAWDAVANATSYKITIGTSVYTSSTNSLDLGEIAETSANDISVKAIEGASYINADDSAKVNLVVLGSVASVSVSEGYFAWDAVENASGYEVEINGAVYETSRNLYKITDGGTYTFRVRAIGSGTYLSAPYTSIKTYTKLSVPANVKISSGKLVWDAVTGAKSYIVNINDIDYPSASNSFLVPSSVTATLLNIKVKAVGDNALVINSEYSDVQSFRKVAQSSISVTGGNTVSWTNTTESSVTSYTVSIGGTGGSSTNAGKVNTYTIPDEDISPLSNGEHTITLIAVGSDDRLSSCTDITVNVMNVRNVVVSDSNVITWDKVDGAASYEVTVNGTVNTVAQSDAPSYDLGSNALSSLTSIMAVGDNYLSVAWTHFTVSIYKGGTLYDTEPVNPGDKLPSTLSLNGTEEIPLSYTDASYSTSFNWSSDIKKDYDLYFTTEYFYFKAGENYVYFGLYPQTVVTDSALLTALSALTTTNSQGYYEYQGYMYAKLSATPYTSGYKFNDNTTVVTKGTTYYFKVEPIKWRILKTSSGSYTLMSEQALDNHMFASSSNNYANSSIRTWLNADFLSKAFYLDGSLIQTTAVDNSLASTGYSSNPYACANTSDKVWLLSYAEATRSSYGFTTDYKTTSTRYCVATDYARAKGCYMDTNSSYYGNCLWWLRSPNYNYSYSARRGQRWQPQQPQLRVLL